METGRTGVGGANIYYSWQLTVWPQVKLFFYSTSLAEYVVLYIYVLFLFPLIKRSTEIALLIAPLGELNTKLSRQA